MILIDHYFVVNSLPEFLNLFICSLLDPFIISEEFWYIYMIIGFYLMLPILYKWIKNATEKEIEYFFKNAENKYLTNLCIEMLCKLKRTGKPHK